MSNCGFPAGGAWPNNQKAFHGLSYSGFYTYAGAWREYIAVKLTDTLEANKEYCVSFRVSRKSIFGGGTDSFGAFFDHDSIFDTSNYNLPFIPQVESPKGMVVSDTLMWTLVSGSFIANGDERFMAIGNFRDDTSTTYIHVDSSKNGFAYYFLDSVWVYNCESSVGINENYKVELSITVTDGVLTFILEEGSRPYDISIFDMRGRVVYERLKHIDLNPKIRLSDFSKGVYVLKLTSPDYMVARKFLYNPQ